MEQAKQATVESRAALLASYYAARALVEARSVKASDVEFARLVATAHAARRAAFEH